MWILSVNVRSQWGIPQRVQASCFISEGVGGTPGKGRWDLRAIRTKILDPIRNKFEDSFWSGQAQGSLQTEIISKYIARSTIRTTETQAAESERRSLTKKCFDYSELVLDNHDTPTGTQGQLPWPRKSFNGTGFPIYGDLILTFTILAIYWTNNWQPVSSIHIFWGYRRFWYLEHGCQDLIRQGWSRSCDPKQFWGVFRFQVNKHHGLFYL